jgi:hypothetical protein
MPYDTRPLEWRANIAGVKKVVKDFGMDTKAAGKLKREIHGVNALRAGKSLGKRGAVIAGAAILYKRHLDKKKAAATVG